MNCVFRRSLYAVLAIVCFAIWQNRDASADEAGVVTIARVKYEGGGDWYSDPTSLPNLLSALRTRCGIPSMDREATVELVSLLSCEGIPFCT